MHVSLHNIRTTIGSPTAFGSKPQRVDTRARLSTTSMEQSGTAIPNWQQTSMQKDTADSPRPLRDSCAPRPHGSSLNGFYGNGMPPGDALSDMAESRTSEDDISTDEAPEKLEQSERSIEMWSRLAAAVYNHWHRRRNLHSEMKHDSEEVQMVLPTSSTAGIELPGSKVP